jgi:hypothetical protein
LMTTTESEREVGLHKLAPRPPGTGSSLIVSLWQKHTPSSGERDLEPSAMSPEAEQRLVGHLNSFVKAPTAPDVAGIPSDELQGVSIERLVPARKGSWWLIPKKVADAEGRKKV